MQLNRHMHIRFSLAGDLLCIRWGRKTAFQALHLGLRVNMMHLVQGMDATVSLPDLVVFLLYTFSLFFISFWESNQSFAYFVERTGLVVCGLVVFCSLTTFRVHRNLWRKSHYLMSGPFASGTALHLSTVGVQMGWQVRAPHTRSQVFGSLLGPTGRVWILFWRPIWKLVRFQSSHV